MEKKRMFRCLLREKRDSNYFLMMRLTIVLTILLTMNVFGTVNSQIVNLKCKNTPLREVFRSLKQQTGYLFVFNEEEIDRTHRVRPWIYMIVRWFRLWMKCYGDCPILTNCSRIWS